MRDKQEPREQLVLLEQILKGEAFDGERDVAIARANPDGTFTIYAKNKNIQFDGNTLREALHTAFCNLPRIKQLSTRELLDEIIERMGPPDEEEGSYDHIICSDGTVYNFQIRRQKSDED